MSNIINFPCRPRALRRAKDRLTIAVSLEVAAHLNAASPEILNSVDSNGGSPATEAFLTRVQKWSGCRLPEPQSCGRRGRHSS